VDKAPLRVAVPNKGSLSADAIGLLTDAGYRAQRNNRDLRRLDTENNIQFFFQRPKDIATYVGRGTLDLGITGQDMVVNSGAPVESVLELGFAKSSFHFAGPADGINAVSDLDGCRIATSYPMIVQKYLADRGVTATLVELDGAVENAIELDVADVIADVVETGDSLRNGGLVRFGEPVMTSQAILVRSTARELTEDQASAVGAMVDRLRGVLNARTYVIMDYDCPKDVLDDACALTPGLESPTISPLADPDWVAVRSLVERSAVQRIMDELRGIGAKAILVTALEACRI
jgi:ATP phosphoribosyltransferase